MDQAGNVPGNLIGAATLSTKKRSITIIDVAEKAGVSVSTVSRVLNNKDDVAIDTSARVQKVIDQLGYASSLAARSMRSRRKNLLGLVVPDIGFPYSIEIMKGINRAIVESTFDLLVYTTGDIRKIGAASHEQHYVSILSNSMTDGVIIVASAAADFVSDAPIVSVDPHGDDPNYPFVQATNYQGAVDATRYLIELGHRRIAFITGRPEIGSGGRRLQGYRDTLESAGIGVDEAYVALGDFTTEKGYQCALQLLGLETPPTAIFAANDQSAIGVFQAAEVLGLRIPQDLSLVGFDNIADAKYLGLTTVDQCLDEMGYVAVQMLIQLVNQDTLENQVYKMPTSLVIRGSCRALT
jgi:LacI family transcriptional regulator, galactose operon repressor